MPNEWTGRMPWSTTTLHKKNIITLLSSAAAAHAAEELSSFLKNRRDFLASCYSKNTPVLDG